MSQKRIVLAEDDSGGTVAVGPVYTAHSLDQLRRKIDDYGWTVRGVAQLISVAQFAAAQTRGDETAGSAR